jgi:hypothetical protein
MALQQELQGAKASAISNVPLISGNQAKKYTHN